MCQGLIALDQGLQTGTQSNAAQTGFYTGTVSTQARDELLGQVVNRILEEPAQPGSLPRWLLSKPCKGLEHVDDDSYRAIISMSIYTLLMEGSFEQVFQGRPVSLDFVAAEVCRCSAPDEEIISWETQGSPDWSVAKVFLVMGLLAGGYSVVMLTESLVVAYVAYYATVLSVGSLILFWNDLDSLPTGQPLEVHTELEDWERAKGRHTGPAAGCTGARQRGSGSYSGRSQS